MFFKIEFDIIDNGEFKQKLFPMKYLSFAFPILLLFFSSCLRVTDEYCKTIRTSNSHYQDSISSGLEMEDGIYAVSLKLKAKLENDIQFNKFSFPAGDLDTLITNRDQYSPTFHYEISNETGGNVELDVCVSFVY